MITLHLPKNKNTSIGEVFGGFTACQARRCWCLMYLRWYRQSVFELDAILLAATAALVKLQLTIHLIELCASATFAAGFRLFCSEENG